MPREQINHPKMVTSENPPGYAYTEPTLHVGWNRAGWVQVHIAAEPAYFRNVAESFDDKTTEISIFTDTLDRVEINRLIRTLRKARDQAYGTDA